MKFKRYGLYIGMIALTELLLLGFALLIFYLDTQGKLFGGSLGMYIFFLALAILDAAVLIWSRHDSVCCDEKSIRISTRKGSFEFAWKEIYEIEKTPRTGLLVKALGGEELVIVPSVLAGAKFTEYVKSVYPALEIKSAAKENKKSVLREACGAVTAPSAAAAQPYTQGRLWQFVDKSM